jgi:hypothetical protein
MAISLTDTELLKVAREDMWKLMRDEKRDEYGRYSPLVERLRSAVENSTEAERLYKLYGDDH